MKAALWLVLACVACRPRGPELPWMEEELGQSRREPAVKRDRGTLAEAQARFAAATTPAEILMGAIDVAALDGELAARRAEISAAIDAASEDELATAAAAADPTRAPSGAIALRLALIAHHRGDDAAARDWLVRFAAAADAADEALAARGATLAAETTPGDARVIAVLLPLSGRYAALGVELKKAIELAPRDGATVVYLDTAGDETAAAAAVDRAAARGAVAILGPVGERESVAAARRAAELGIPIALLAPADGADPEAGVFRMTDSPADEARGTARLAALESFPTAAVLAPRDDVGEAMADAFAAEAAAQGITVTRIGFYDPTATDLQPDIEAFLKVRYRGRKSKRAPVPDVDFSLLYLPDRYDRAALVTAYLPYLGVELATTEMPDPQMLARKHGGRIPQVVQLFGSSGWRHPGLITRGGDDVEGAMFVDTCAGQFDDGTEASSAALESFDAARIVFAARRRGVGADDPREEIRVALAHARLTDGVCPVAAMGSDGELAREPEVFLVDGGEFVLQSY